MPVCPKAFPSSTGAHALEPQGTRPVCGSARLVGARHTPVKPLCLPCLSFLSSHVTLATHAVILEDNSFLRHGSEGQRKAFP